MRRDGLAVGEKEDFGVLLAAGEDGVGVEVGGEVGAAVKCVLVALPGLGEGLVDGLAVLVPDGGAGIAPDAEALTEIVVGDEDERAVGVGLACGRDEREVGGLFLRGALVVVDRLDLEGDLLARRLREGGGVGGEDEGAPLDAVVVAVAFEDARLRVLHADGVEAFDLILADGDGRVALLVHAELLREGDGDGDVVVAVVERLGEKAEIDDGTGEKVEVVEKERAREVDDELDAAGREDVFRRAGLDLEGRLRHGGFGAASHEAVFDAVDLGDADHEVGAAGPVGRVAVSQAVGGGPDAEEGVDGDERYGGGAELHNQLKVES